MKARFKLTPTRGSVLLLASLFIGSACLRVASGASAVLAADPASSETAENKTEISAEIPAEQTKPTQALLDALLRREASVTEREEKVENRIATMKIAEQELQERLATLENAEIRLRETIALAETAAEDDLNKLTAVYENMKPKDAAALFEKMDPEFAAGFMARMRPEAAANLMSGLSPQVAYSVSAILAGRNVNVPTE